MTLRVGMSRRQYLVAAAIFALVVGLRLPFATTHLWAWDSVLYARALEQGFHVAADPAVSRPHPPGYIGYIAAAALARAALDDSNAALVLVSILACAASAALLFLIATRYVRPAVALLVTLAYAASPVVWTYSEVAYPYTVLGLVSIALGGVFLARRWPVAASLAFGILAGARQDVLVLLAPLWLWSVWPRSPREAMARGGLVAIGTLTWLVPSIVLSGGTDGYLGALLQQAGRVADTYSVPVRGLPALVQNAGFTVEAIVWGLGLFVVPLVIGAAVALRSWQHRSAPMDPLLVGLTLWAAPAIVFYTLVHIGEWGYVLSVLPALLLGSAVVLDRAHPAVLPRRVVGGGVAQVAVLAGVFLFGDGVFSAVVGTAVFSADALVHHDARLNADITYVRRTFDRRTTVVLTREDHLLVRYYLPEYRAWYWDPDPYRAESKRHRTMRAMNVVVLTPGLQPLLQSEARRIEIAPGIDVFHVPLEAGNVLELTGERYVVRESPGR